MSTRRWKTLLFFFSYQTATTSARPLTWIHGLTFARVASLDVSGDADDSQSVDAREAEEQREEAVHLVGDRRSGSWMVAAHLQKHLGCSQSPSGDRLLHCSSPLSAETLSDRDAMLRIYLRPLSFRLQASHLMGAAFFLSSKQLLPQ